MNVRVRQDAIIRSLRRNGTLTVAGLSEIVGVSRRTVLRDISTLREEGFVIHSEAGRGGGLRLEAQSVWTSARITVVEVFSLIISVTAMRATGSMPFSCIADAGLAKIEKSLSSDKIKDLRRLLDGLYIGKLASGVDTTNIREIDSNLLPTFEIAFLQRRIIRFKYFDAKGVTTNRKVEPQAILILWPLWYLVAWDPLRNDFRHFRMDRIKLPEIVEGSKFRQRYVPFEDNVSQYRNLAR
ncbi:helix-turn-helix transcriptional regulator [Vibrio navarrensis]|uniref:helix-turn-helix transcriptional regulator n=1 Tax=Vibrio navarrensis TaxID=29495 RepID=UPI001302B91B|nr:WYL domain-containing protein [Vibrio navarrensis]EJL6401102.1 WYL domain-containing protein [Vibrio navarrensis]EJL6568448.1 WYL domain-containing protein [Vibrio navarrensis]